MFIFLLFPFAITFLHILATLTNLSKHRTVSSTDLFLPRRKDMSEWCIITFPDHIAFKINPESECWSSFSMKIPPTAFTIQITGSGDYSQVNCKPSENKIPGVCSSLIRNCTLEENLTCFVYWSAFGWNLSIGWMELFPKMPTYSDKNCDLLEPINMFPLGCMPY